MNYEKASLSLLALVEFKCRGNRLTTESAERNKRAQRKIPGILTDLPSAAGFPTDAHRYSHGFPQIYLRQARF